MKKLIAAAALASATLLGGCATFVGHDLVGGEAPVGEVVVRNNSAITIGFVTISRCSAMSHGLNRLEGTIPPGGARRWRVDQGCWDVQAGQNVTNGYVYASFGNVQVSGGRQNLLTIQ